MISEEKYKEVLKQRDEAVALLKSLAGVSSAILPDYRHLAAPDQEDDEVVRGFRETNIKCVETALTAARAFLASLDGGKR